MFKSIINMVNSRKYELMYNSKKINIDVERIKGMKEFKDSLISVSEMDFDKGFFIYNEPNFASVGLKNNVDLVWVDWNGKIIMIKESFIPNKISEEIKEAKFIYILKEGTVGRKRIVLNNVLTHMYDRKMANNKLPFSI